MRLFKVRLSRLVSQEAEIFVPAATEDEAKAKALEDAVGVAEILWDDGEFEPHTHQVENIELQV